MARARKFSFARLILYGLSFLIGAQSAMVVFFNSSFLESVGFSESAISLLYVVASASSVGLLFVANRLLRSFGAFRTTLAASGALILFFSTLALTHNTWFVIVAFIAALVSQVLLWFCLDIFLEHYTCSEDGTGDVRSSALTASNIAFASAPIGTGALLEAVGFSGMYFMAALIVIVIIIIAVINLRTFKDPKYESLNFKSAIKEIKQRADIRHIFIAAFFLYFFYASMTIYMPLYLQHIGFSLAQIGLMFSIMILPFATLQYPLGHFIDHWIGEREMLISGYLLMAIATATIALTSSTSLIVWVTLLVLTRIGAATVEIMNEIYFFKHVKAGDTDTISVFRMLYSAAYVAGPLVGMTILYISDMRFIFFFLSLFLLTSVYASTVLKDTK